jgi:hypothetical protein
MMGASSDQGRTINMDTVTIDLKETAPQRLAFCRKFCEQIGMRDIPLRQEPDNTAYFHALPAGTLVAEGIRVSEGDSRPMKLLLEEGMLLRDGGTTVLKPGRCSKSGIEDQDGDRVRQDRFDGFDHRFVKFRDRLCRTILRVLSF